MLHARARALPKTRNLIFAAIAIVDLTGCATISQHAFVEPTSAWQTRSGQLLYRAPKVTLIGDVLVRYSKNGDIELTFSKAPGITLLTLRQDAKFAEVNGPLVRMGWAGPVDRAPKQLRSWLELRDKITHAQDRQSVRYSSGQETFLLRF
jgi:hypothetical protein